VTRRRWIILVEVLPASSHRRRCPLSHGTRATKDGVSGREQPAEPRDYCKYSVQNTEQRVQSTPYRRTVRALERVDELATMHRTSLHKCPCMQPPTHKARFGTHRPPPAAFSAFSDFSSPWKYGVLYGVLYGVPRHGITNLFRYPISQSWPKRPTQLYRRTLVRSRHVTVPCCHACRGRHLSSQSDSSFIQQLSSNPAIQTTISL
jgi:hypothetical protein